MLSPLALVFLPFLVYFMVSQGLMNGKSKTKKKHEKLAQRLPGFQDTGEYDKFKVS